MVTRIRIDKSAAAEEFGMSCQRIIPWPGADKEPPVGAMACFLPGRSESEPDVHDQDEVMLVLSGAGRVTLGDEETECRAGDVVVLQRNREHVVYNPHDEELSWVSFYWPLHEPGGETA